MHNLGKTACTQVHILARSSMRGFTVRTNPSLSDSTAKQSEVIGYSVISPRDTNAMRAASCSASFFTCFLSLWYCIPSTLSVQMKPGGPFTVTQTVVYDGIGLFFFCTYSCSLFLKVTCGWLLGAPAVAAEMKHNSVL